MKKKLIFASILALTIFISKAQNSANQHSTGIIKIVTVDENGNKSEMIQSLSDLDEESLNALKKQLKEIDNADFEGVTVMSTSGKNNVEVNVETDGLKYIVHQSILEQGPFLGIHLAEHDQGILITHVVEGSGAAAAGLEKGDVITAFNGQPIATHADLKEALSNQKVGDKIKLDYLRNDKLKKASVTLGEYPEKEYDRKILWINDGEEVVFPDGNLSIGEDYEKLKTQPFLGITPVKDLQDISGLMIYEVVEGSSAEKLGLQTGDIIYEVNKTTVDDFDDLVDVLKKMKPGERISVSYKRDGVKKKTVGLLGSKADAHKTMDLRVQELYFDSDEKREKDYIVVGVSSSEMEMLSDKTGHNLKEFPKLKNADVLLYPNPNNGEFKIEFNNEVKAPLEIKVFDAKGQEMYSENVKDFNGKYVNTINLQGASGANYFLVIIQNGQVMTEKILIR